MGCTLSNIKLRLENRRQNKYRFATTQVIQIDIQKEYDEAAQLCEQYRYIEAQEKLLLVNQHYPNFPCLQINLNQIKRLIQAKQKYDQGQRLLDDQKYDEALTKFQDIQSDLQSNFKDVNQQIHYCRQKKEEQQRWIKQNHDLIEEFKRLLLIRQDYIKKLEEEKASLIKSYEEKLRVSIMGQNNQSRLNEDQNISFTKINKPEQRERLPPIDINSSTSTIFNKVQIYFVCTKKPKCPEWKEGSIFKHSTCGTNAFFHFDGKISCLNNCATYTIKEALFSCKNNQVCQNDQKQNQQDYESIDSMPLLADFVEDCLIKDNHAEIDQNEFRGKVGGGALMLYLL